MKKKLIARYESYLGIVEMKIQSGELQRSTYKNYKTAYHNLIKFLEHKKINDIDIKECCPNATE